jgi:hypothetical protein
LSAIDLTLPLEGRQIGDRELMRRLEISRSKFYALKAQGQFDFLMPKHKVLKVSRYCGALVKLYVDGTKVQRVEASEPKPGPRLVNARASR